MHQGNWTCSKCGGAITELPFEPKSDKGLTCRDCYFKSKDGAAAPSPTPASADEQTDAPPFDPEASASEPAPAVPDEVDGKAPAGEKPLFSGNWQCATCGGSITQLPFEPRDTSNLKCLDCFKASKG